jgi:hypothetical protein
LFKTGGFIARQGANDVKLNALRKQFKKFNIGAITYIAQYV